MTILLTGATSGIGLATAIALARSGSDISIVGRTAESTTEAVGLIRAHAEDGVDVDGFAADLGRPAAVDRLAQTILDTGMAVDGLVLCAAVVNPVPAVVDGLDVTLAVNHLSPVILCARLDSALGRSGRIVLVSSSQHGAAGPFDSELFTRSGHMTRKYEATKLLNLLFAQSRLAHPHEAPMEVIDPGFVRTSLGRNARGARRALLAVTRPIQGSPAVPADLIVRRLRSDDFTDGCYLAHGGPARRAANVTSAAAESAWQWTDDLLGRRGRPDSSPRSR